MNITQDHILIKEISDDIVFLKDGGGALVLAVSAVNFGLLSEREQLAIIESFAHLLNSLSFSIQIVILSKRLNISSYLLLLDQALKKQTNPLLSKMISNYSQFVQTLIKENEVLDKKFFCVIPLYKLELGLLTSKDTLSQKVKTILLPRRDQLIRQLARAGLKAQQLTTEKLVELFYDLYNWSEEEVSIQSQPTQLKTLPSPTIPKPVLPETSQPQPPQPKTEVAPMARAKTHPFVVEELEEG